MEGNNSFSDTFLKAISVTFQGGRALQLDSSG
jgi:hypothetical protein